MIWNRIREHERRVTLSPRPRLVPGAQIDVTMLAKLFDDHDGRATMAELERAVGERGYPFGLRELTAAGRYRPDVIAIDVRVVKTKHANACACCRGPERFADFTVTPPYMIMVASALHLTVPIGGRPYAPGKADHLDFAPHVDFLLDRLLELRSRTIYARRWGDDGSAFCFEIPPDPDDRGLPEDGDEP